MFTKDEIIVYLKEHYPNEDTRAICDSLGLSLGSVRTSATRNGIHKSSDYLRKLHIELMKIKEQKYLASIPNVELSQMERNIIVGSILGDGSLTFAPRSRNAYYREHYSLKQKQYREWKLNNINSFKFRIENECHLKSPSHSVFTELYNQFYMSGTKVITEENVKLLNHPIGLVCLYLDDGTLVVNFGKARKNIYLSPTLSITTLCFSKAECQILIEHIAESFGIHFYLSPARYGEGWIIRISKLEEVLKFFNLIIPYCRDISCLRYKWDFSFSLERKRQELVEKLSENHNIYISSINNIPHYYSMEEQDIICAMKRNGKTYDEIANATGRTYHAITYKIRHLKQQGKI